MPTIDYTCPRCGHSFKRVALMDEEPPPAACPRCKASKVKPIRGSTGLFNGIASFSRLANDTN
jgi:putative FmdB family regulatory protein